MQILKIFTCGNVDDGKSTLIGRLLVDSEGISTDILTQLTELGGGTLNLALLTDGLRAERSMGITIDVAYKFFYTEQTKYILVDTPGHPEYTRNMYAGASECSAAIVLIDVQKPIEAQTKKHLQIMEALNIKQVIFALNKMDAVDFNKQVFLQRKQEADACLQHREHRHIWIPLSALSGDNVVHRSTKTPWYDGMSLLEALESIPYSQPLSGKAAYIEVQGVHGKVVYARVLQGLLSPGTVLFRGDESLPMIQLLGNGKPAPNHMGEGQLSFMLDGNATVERGQYWGTTPIQAAHSLEINLCWMANEPSGKEMHLLMQRGTSLTAVNLSLDEVMEPNDLRTIHLRLLKPIDMVQGMECDNEKIVLIDPHTKQTLAAGRIEKWTT